MPYCKHGQFILIFGCLAPLLAWSTPGCLRRELTPVNPCLVTGVADRVDVRGIDKVDLLFVVDNSGSMADEQANLRRQFPLLIETLTSGVRQDGGTFAPARDLHLGITTTDLGTPGLANGPLPDDLQCEGVGEDARLLKDCAGFTIPNGRAFLTYRVDQGATPQEIANQFACLAAVGDQGCTYEMQLDAVLKALYPAPGFDLDASGTPLLPAPPLFLADPKNPQSAYGHGGPLGAATANAGFLRSATDDGPSLLAIVLVTDEDDCSSIDVSPFENGVDNQPYLRCFNFKQKLQPVQRYIDGLKALRKGYEDLVIFAAIAGVPPTLVSPDAYSRVDLDNEAERNAFYDNILADPDMQETPDFAAFPVPALENACSTFAGGGAKPARRITEVVRGFGANGVLQSICQNSFEPAINAIIEVIASRLGDVCLPRRLARGSDGTVDCKVVWELPLPLDPGASGDAPTSCDMKPYLSQVSDRPFTANGRARCEVDQLPIMNEVQPNGDGIEGWFYDDFTEQIARCSGVNKQRVAFTAGAEPANGVTVRLECLNQIQVVPQTREDVDTRFYTRRNQEAPTIGTFCEGSDEQCRLRLRGGDESDDLFCHQERYVCVQGCDTDADCPPAWVCDTREDETIRAGGQRNPRAFCVNPTCGTSR